MASNNTNMDVLYPEFWASAFDELDQGQYNLQNLISRDEENLIASSGDTINIPIQPDFGVAPTWVEGAAIVAESINQTVKQVVLNQAKQQAIQLTGRELSLSPYNLMKTYGIPMAEALLMAVNNSIYTAALASTNFLYVGAVTGLDEDDIIDARTRLSQANVPMSDRVIVAGPTDMGKLLQCDAFQHANVSGSLEVMKDGLLVRKFGFDFYENPTLETYTPADLAGAVNNKGAAYAAGATTVVVDTFNDDANPLRVGDIITFAAESPVTQHTITAVTVTDSDTTSITFSPALVGATPANDEAVITVIPSRSLIAMRKNAIAGAFRAFAPLPAGAGVQSSIVNANGIPVRISVFHDGKLGVYVTADILYGVSLVNSDRIVRIITY